MVLHVLIFSRPVCNYPSFRHGPSFNRLMYRSLSVLCFLRFICWRSRKKAPFSLKFNKRSPFIRIFSCDILSFSLLQKSFSSGQTNKQKYSGRPSTQKMAMKGHRNKKSCVWHHTLIDCMEWSPARWSGIRFLAQLYPKPIEETIDHEATVDSSFSLAVTPENLSGRRMELSFPAPAESSGV